MILKVTYGVRPNCLERIPSMSSTGRISTLFCSFMFDYISVVSCIMKVHLRLQLPTFSNINGELVFRILRAWLQLCLGNLAWFSNFSSRRREFPVHTALGNTQSEVHSATDLLRIHQMLRNAMRFLKVASFKRFSKGIKSYNFEFCLKVVALL